MEKHVPNKVRGVIDRQYDARLRQAQDRFVVTLAETMETLDITNDDLRSGLRARHIFFSPSTFRAALDGQRISDRFLQGILAVLADHGQESGHPVDLWPLRLAAMDVTERLSEKSREWGR